MNSENWDRKIIAAMECEMYSYIAEMRGMEAENKQREIEGNAMAYTEKDFIEVRNNLLALSNGIREYGM